MQFLHDTSWADDWTVWLDAAGCVGQFETAGPAFSLYALAVEEAKAGGGVLIGHEPLVLAAARGRDAGRALRAARKRSTGHCSCRLRQGRNAARRWERLIGVMSAD